jgi:hypothetical protein
MLRAMGNLAQRYLDAARSGVYRVRDAGIPRTAAVEANALLVEVAASELPGNWRRIEQAIERGAVPACVLVVADAHTLSGAERRGTMERIAQAALAARARGRPFFAVMVDPGGRLALPPLYREKDSP